MSGRGAAPVAAGPERLAGPGGSLPSGKREEPNEAGPLAEEAVEGILRRYGAPLDAALREDFEEEKKKVKDSRGYKDFKPLVLIVDGAAQKLFAGLGYTDATEGSGKVFDFAKADLAKVLAAAADLAEGLYKKEAVRDRCLDALRAWLNARLSAANPDGQTAIPARPQAPAGGGDPGDAARAEAWARKQWQERIGALVSLAVGLVRLLAAVYPALRGDDPKPPTNATELWEKRGKPFFTAVTEIAAALLTLLAAREGQAKLQALADKLRGGAPELDAREEALASEIDAKLGLSQAKRDENAKKRREQREKGAKKLAEATRGKTVADEIAKVLKGVAGLIDAVIKADKAWSKAFPKELAGEWDLLGVPDDGLAWVLALEKGADDYSYKGKVSVRGVEPQPVQRGALGAVTLLTEERATVALRHVPAAASARFTWTPKLPAKPKLRAQGDAALAARGGRAAVEELAFHGPRLFSGPSRLGVGALPGGAPGQEPPPRALTLTRPLRFGAVLEVLKAFFDVVGAAPKALPTELERQVTLWVTERIGPLLASIEGRIVGPRLRAVLEVIDCEWKDGRLRLGLKKGLSKVSATWDAVAIIEHLLKDERTIPDGQRSPFVPVALAGALKLPRVPGSIAIAWEPWDPKAKGAELCGKQGLEDKLDGLANWKATFDAYLAGLGAKVDLLPPSLGSAENLPALAIPICLYLDRYTPEGDTVPFELRSKLTFTVTIHAEAVAALFPQLRACLIAWDAGWAIGTFTRQQLLKNASYRAFERDVQQGLANRFGAADYYEALASYGNHTARLLERGLITAQEAYLAWAKTGVFVWREVLREGDRIGRRGMPPDWDPDRYVQWRDVLRQQLAHLRARDQAKGGDGQPPCALAPRYVDTEAELLLLLFLWGGAEPTREDVLAAIDQGERGAGKALPPGRAELLRLFARLRPLASGKPDWERASAHEERLRALLAAEPPQLERVSGAGQSLRREQVENPRHKDAKLAVELIDANDRNDYVTFARILTHSVKPRHLSMERLEDGGKARARLYWDRPGRALEVRLFDDRTGFDQELTSAPWKVQSAAEPIDLEALLGKLGGVQATLAGWAFKERTHERAFKMYATVRDGDETWESARYAVRLHAWDGERYAVDAAGKPNGGPGRIAALALER